MTIQYKVWTEECKKDKDENIYYFRLFTHENAITLNFVNKNGEKIKNSTILIFSFVHKHLILSQGVDDELPIKTDILGIPLIIKDPEYDAICEEMQKKHIFAKISANITEENNENSKEVKH